MRGGKDHKYRYNKYLKDGILNMSTHPFYDKYGIQSFRIVLIKSYKVCSVSNWDNTHLKVYEQLWLNKTKKAVNLYKAFNPLAKLDENIHQNKYYQNNKEEICEKKKKWYQNNKEKVLEKMKEKRTCECGINITRSNLSAHKKTKKHEKFYAKI